MRAVSILKKSHLRRGSIDRLLHNVVVAIVLSCANERAVKMKYTLCALPFLALAACGPISPQEAADQCEERARAAQGPTGEARIGVNSEKGVVGGVSLKITSDFVAGRDPQIVYENCVVQKTGQGPVRPLRL